MNTETRQAIIELIVANATDQYGPNPEKSIYTPDGSIHIELEYKLKWSDVVCDVHLIGVGEYLCSDEECYEIQTEANEKIETPWFS